MSEIENIEIRVLLVGAESVGKKSIISRFKILNSSSTIIEPRKTLPESTVKLSGIDKISKDSFYTSKYSASEKKKLKNLIDFSKILTISNYNIELKFFPISTADKFDIGDAIIEEDEHLKIHKMKFDNIKAEIEKIIIKQPRIHLAEVKFLFFFIIDLHNFESSFEKLKIYNDTLEKYLDISTNHFKVLIGNKVDIKDNNIDRHTIDEYAVKNRFIYYEISCKMFFNFEIFFERLFFNTFEKANPGFSTKYFKERFNYIMTYRQTFSKAERVSMKANNFPGPQQYNSNVYSLENDIGNGNGNKSENLIFSSDRFKTKIFVNKTGPIFNHKKDNFSNKQINKIVERNNNIHKEDKEDFVGAEKKRKLKEEMLGHHPGYSMGNREVTVKLRRKRKEEYNTMMENLENIFDLDNITNKKLKRSKTTQKSIVDIKKKKEMIIQQRINRLKKKKKVLKNRNNNYNKNNNSFNVEDKIAKELFENIKMKVDLDMKRPQSFSNISSSNKIKINRRAISEKKRKKHKNQHPGPATYDVRGKINLDKGYTFGSKYESSQLKNNYGPGYLYLESDIDKMLKEPKFA